MATTVMLGAAVDALIKRFLPTGYGTLTVEAKDGKNTLISAESTYALIDLGVVRRSQLEVIEED